MYIPSYGNRLSALQRRLSVLLALILVLCVASWTQPASAADNISLENILASIDASEIFPDAAVFGPIEGVQPAAAVLSSRGVPMGFVFLNTDYLQSNGYSGKPLYILIAVNNDGIIRGVKLISHSEPIVLIGIAPERIENFINGYAGLDVITGISMREGTSLPVDIISGATVTVLVIDDSIRRSTVRFARSRHLAGLVPLFDRGPRLELNQSITSPSNWSDLTKEGAIGRLKMTVRDINQAFKDTGNLGATKRRATGKPDDTYISMYTALVSQPAIGRTLLGDRGYDALRARMEEGQHAILIMSNGAYSFKRPGFAQGGVFDRIQLVQGEESFHFQDKIYKRVRKVEGRRAPTFIDVGLFLLPANERFDPARPWRLQILVQRKAGEDERAYVTRSVAYELPAKYVISTPRTEAESLEVRLKEAAADAAGSQLWKTVWQTRTVDIAILAVGIFTLTVFFFGQTWFVARPNLLKFFRIGFLIFTFGFIGLYANAQISIVNVFAFTHALLTDFKWDYFLMDPMMFILWCSVAAAVILWGRGAYCGWLCPFGALQELLNMVAKALKIPQWTVPWPIHEILWPIKYMIFLGLFGLSFYSLVLAETLAEFEPFKTVIILKFAREWPYILYAATILTAGLFVERVFCRYLCPLGAALAVPGRLRINDWLKRYSQCGTPCTRCANECMVQAIHPDGSLNVNECLYCLHCQELYACDDRCPVVIQQRLRFERRLAAQSAIMTPESKSK